MASSQNYIECSNFTFTAGSKIKDLPVKEFSNMGMDAPPTDHVAESGKNGEKTMQPKPSPVKPMNPTIVLAGCKDKSAYTWFAKVNPPTNNNPDLIQASSLSFDDEDGRSTIVHQGTMDLVK